LFLTILEDWRLKMLFEEEEMDEEMDEEIW
jgi:hypothetical protein